MILHTLANKRPLLARIAAVAAAVAMTVSCWMPTPAQAAGAGTGQGTLILEPKVGDQVVDDSYDGTFSLYLVATGIETGNYDLTAAFEGYKSASGYQRITQDSLMDDASRKEITEVLAAYVTANQDTIKADPDDCKAFTEYTLPCGLYLVMQRKVGSGYNECTPMLISIPAYNKDADGKITTSYTVTAYPKLTKTSNPPETPPDNPPGHHDTPPTTPAETGRLALGKADGVTGTPLQGVTFILYKEDGTVVGTYVTDENGLIYVDHLPLGRYYFVEQQALDGYILDQTQQWATVEANATARIAMVNQPVPAEEVPEETHGFTGDESNMMIYGIVAVVAAAALVGWIVWTRRSRNQNS